MIKVIIFFLGIGLSQVALCQHTLMKNNNVLTIFHKLGDYYQGGIIFYLDAMSDVTISQHGLIAAINDVTPTICEWDSSAYPILIGSAGAEIFHGKNNTQVILGSSHANFAMAALAASNYHYEEYQDWYLPSQNELSLMFIQKDLIDEAANAQGGRRFLAAPYWSSTEITDKFAWFKDFSSGMELNGFKNQKLNVRAIRSF